VRGARTAGAEPGPSALPTGALQPMDAVEVERTANATAGTARPSATPRPQTCEIMVAKQRLYVGPTHAGKTVTVVIEDTAFRVLRIRLRSPGASHCQVVRQ